MRGHFKMNYESPTHVRQQCSYCIDWDLLCAEYAEKFQIEAQASLQAERTLPIRPKLRRQEAFTEKEGSCVPPKQKGDTQLNVG